MLLAGIDLRTVQMFLAQKSIEDFAKEYQNLGATRQAEKKLIKEHKIPKVKKGEEVNLDVNDLVKTLDSSNRVALTMFIHYKKAVAPLNAFILALKVGEQGLGPTDSDNLRKIDQTDPVQFIDNIIGFDLLYDDKLFTTYINRVLSEGRDIIIDNTNMIDRNRGTFKANREEITNWKADGWMTTKEIEFLNNNFLDYLWTLEVQEHDKKIANTVPGILLAYKNANPNSPYNPLLNRLTVKDGYIYYNGSRNDEQVVIDTFELMLKDSNETVRSIAENLIKYSNMLSVYRITPHNFNHIIPPVYYTSQDQVNKMDKFESVINSQYQDTFPNRNFINQFVANHYRNLSYIPSYDYDEHKANIVINNGKPTNLIVFDETNLDKQKEPLQYVKVSYKKEQYLMKLNFSLSNTEYSSYTLVPPMGTYQKKLGKMFVEYNETGISTYKENRGYEIPDASKKSESIGETKSNLNWSTYEQKLTEKYPDLTEEAFNNMTFEEQKNLIDCL